MASPSETRASGETYCYRHPDRETLLSCSSCERPICTSCMHQAAVGVRCPECAGGGASARGRGGGGPARRRMGGMGASVSRRSDQAVATVGLVAVTGAAFLGQILGGEGILGRGAGGLSRLTIEGALFGPAVAAGDWYRLVTSAFLHASVLHILFNMYLLWLLGGALERYAGAPRMLTVYFIAILWGSAGALVLDPLALTIGASGGVFGLMAALFLLERTKGVALLGGSVGVLLALNLVITFFIPNISIGGHVGGLLGGAAAAFVLSGFGRGHLAYGRVALPAMAALVGLVAVAVVVSGVAVA